MKKVRLNGSDIKSLDEIIITGSKSESNRVLILKSIFQNISIINLSSSDDTKILEKNLNSKDFNLNIQFMYFILICLRCRYVGCLSMTYIGFHNGGRV